MHQNNVLEILCCIKESTNILHKMLLYFLPLNSFLNAINFCNVFIYCITKNGNAFNLILQSRKLTHMFENVVGFKHKKNSQVYVFIIQPIWWKMSYPDLVFSLHVLGKISYSLISYNETSVKEKTRKDKKHNDVFKTTINLMKDSIKALQPYASLDTFCYLRLKYLEK